VGELLGIVVKELLGEWLRRVEEWLGERLGWLEVWLNDK